MCTLKSPMSQVMSHTSAMAITDQNEGENLLPSEIFVGGGGEVTNHPVAYYAVSL